MQTAFLTACGFLLIGVILRRAVRWFAIAHIPAALVAGIVALIVVQLNQIPWFRDASSGFVASESIDAIASQWSGWRSTLIPIIFAGLLLSGASGSAKQNARETAQQTFAAWILILGQLALGLLVTVLFLSPVFKVPIHFGQLLEVSWAGGFGSANAWGEMHKSLGVYPGAGDLATFFTTCGLLWGVVGGMILVNIALRRGWTSRDAGSIESESEDFAAPRAVRVAPSLDPLLFQIILLACAFAVGVILQQLLVLIARRTIDNVATVKLLSELPLFVFTLFGGWIVRSFLRTIGRGNIIDEETMHRLTGVALDLLIFVAVATLQLGMIRDNWLPALLLMLLGAAWVMFNVMWISPRILPASCWFELAIMNHGFSTATTAQSMMLLRIVDPELRTDAARIYALAAPLTAMFIGGGLFTLLLPKLLQAGAAWWIIALATIVIVVMYAIARGWARSSLRNITKMS